VLLRRDGRVRDRESIDVVFVGFLEKSKTIQLIVFLIIVDDIELLWWANPGGTAMPGQPVAVVEQAPSTPSISKNQFNILDV
jgi:hypothetical protein